MMASVLITGTSKGIGFEAALAFARAGHRVHATMRNPSKSPALAETAVPTRLLSEFYEFLGLDPTELFEARLGNINTTSGFDVKNLEATEQALCFYRLGFGENLDPTQVTLKDAAACTGS
jgi:NAD(P)-dependent dehydrogenase (short-subunit alcohol dehydrogenase family)